MPPHNAPNWKDLVVTLTHRSEFGPPAEESRISEVERSLRVRLPDALREFLLESDGLVADYSSGVIWSVADLERKNREFREHPEFRSLYMPFDHLLFFGEDSGGDQFAFAIQADGLIDRSDVYRWEHETDGRPWFAGHLHQYFEFRLTMREADE